LAELNLEQIEDKLNLEFTGDNRKLVSIIDRYTKEDYKMIPIIESSIII